LGYLPRVLFFNAFELGAENANQVISKESLRSTVGVFSIINWVVSKWVFEDWYVQNVSTFPNTFAIVSPLICVFWMQLTRTNAVFSRIALVSCFCAEIQLSVKIRKKLAKILFHQKTHRARRRDGGEARGLLTHRGRGPGLVVPTWCEGGSAISSTPPSAYIYPFTWKYRGDVVFSR
jgi:hypothetical protein